MPFFDYKNHRLFYLDEGSHEKVLLFIHGLGGASQLWRHQVDYFKSKYRVVAVDLFGHGQSDKEIAPEVAPWMDVEAIYLLMRDVIQSDYVAVGHSYATNVLPELMKLDYQHLRGVVFADCVYQGKKINLERQVAFGKLMLAHHESLFNSEVEQWYSKLMGKAISQNDKEFLFNTLMSCNLRWLFQSVVALEKFCQQLPGR